MKKRLFILFVLICTSFINVFAVITGTGTSSDPWVINTEDDLISVMTNTSYWANGTYIELARNLDMTGYTTCVPIGGNLFNPYMGSFDGNNHVIKNLTINLPSTSFVGLFGSTSSYASLKNIGVENANMTGAYDVGCLCGLNNTTVTNCYTTGTATGEYHIGGFCGENYGVGIISYCYTTASATGNAPSSENTGGFCGINNGIISFCYSTGNASGYSNVGGFCGTNYYGQISDCYSLGNANGTYNVGGFTGLGEYFCGHHQCYSMGVPTGSSSTGGFMGRWYGTQALRLTCNFWGFANIPSNMKDIGSDFYPDRDDSQVKKLSLEEFADFSNFPCFNPTIWGVVGEHPVFIPTLSEWAVIVFISLIGVIGCWFVWKRLL